MRHAAAILIASLTALVPSPAAPQETAPSPAAAGPSDVKVAGRDVPAPKRTHFVSPVFPPEAQAAGQRGIVILELLIDTTGKVATADVLRSVAPFDDAALVAARQWEYEVTKVDGKPVPVRLTVPITFALRLPEMTRETGIPELRQGALPFFPAGAKGPATVVADVTLLPDGTLAEAAIKEGDSPWAEAMLQTLRTWRFGSDPEAPPVSFQVRAQFQPGPPPKVDLKLSGLRTGERPSPSPAAAQAPAIVPPQGTAPATETPSATATPPVSGTPSVSGASPAPATAPAAVAASPAVTTPSPAAPTSVEPPHAAPSPLAAPTASGGPTVTTSPAPGPATVPSPLAPSVPTPRTTPAPGVPAPAAPAPVTPGPVPPGPVPPGPATPGANPPATPPPQLPGPPAPPRSAPTPPPVEVIPGGPPSASSTAGAAPGATPTPAPREAGISAVRDVNLGPGVPDLTKGRRPVAPPFARMSASSGSVQVQFSVDAAGGTSIQNVSGPELLKEAARQAVSSWAFRRTTPERLYLVAVFTYEGDKAQAEIKRAE